jgi:hypothetical protein
MNLTQVGVRELFDYREDGFLIWKISPAQRINIGDVAGTYSKEYASVYIGGNPYKVHRIIFLWHHGYMPHEVDHRDLDTKNNRIGNLREASHSQNMANRRLFKNNSSGYKGVHWHKRTQKWCASIRVDKKLIHLGYYHNPDAAHAAYVKAAQVHRGDFARAA